ncbi:MAG: hypothetical protein U0350_06390 [Caldilineaceae bacterium]
MNALHIRKNTISIILLTAVLISAVFTGVVNALNSNTTHTLKANLSNVRAYAPAVSPSHISYAVDGGVLFAGGPQGWGEVKTPDNIIVGAVAVNNSNEQTLYVGAANEMTLYRSTDAGQHWLRIPLNKNIVGGVTDIAVDNSQRLVYVGTDNAGIFRLRDVGSSMILSGQTPLDQPVLDVAADSTGHGLAFVRTANKLYRAENGGLTWVTVDNLNSLPTALAISNGQPATVYVGTTDRGLLKSNDGQNWTTANAGLGLVPGSRLHVDALAADPVQSNVLYVATSYLYGSTEVHQSPVGVALSTDNAQKWTALYNNDKTAIAALLPVTGETGAVYALTNQSRTPLALGKATEFVAKAAPQSVNATSSVFDSGILAWIVAGLAALALLFAIGNDLRSRRTPTSKPLAPGMVRNSR